MTLLSILTDLNNAVVSMVSNRPLISKSSSSSTKPLVTILIWPIIIGITVTFMFTSFFQFSCKVLGLIILFAFFQFYPVVSRNGKVHKSAGSFFSFYNLFTFFHFYWLTDFSSDRLAEIRWSICFSKFQRILSVSFSKRILGCAYSICLYVQI